MIGHSDDHRDGAAADRAREPSQSKTSQLKTSQPKTRPAAFARLKERSEFLAVAKGARMHEAAFTLQANVRNMGEAGRRFGLTVTKKTGNSVVRNRIRRRLREALRLSGVARDDTADGGARDYVIVARREVLSRNFAGLTHDMTQAVKRIDKRLASRHGPSPSGGKPLA